MAARRWIRLDVGWSNSDWLIELSPGGRLAWIYLLEYVKSSGIGGRVKALSALAAGKRWDINRRDVSAMLSAAQKDGALVAGEGVWIVSNWNRYQETDSNAAERKRRQRDRQAKAQSRGDTESHGTSRKSRRDNRDVRRDMSRDRDIDKEKKKDLGDERSGTGDPPSSKPTELRRRKTKASPPRSPDSGGSWSRAACNAWQARLGKPPGARIGSALKPLVKQHGEAVVLSVWRYYLEHEKPKFANPQDFASKFAVWQRQVGTNGTAPPDMRDQLEKGLAMVLRQDPGFQGGIPDPHSTGFAIPTGYGGLWDEVLKAAGLKTAAEMRGESS